MDFLRRKAHWLKLTNHAWIFPLKAGRKAAYNSFMPRFALCAVHFLTIFALNTVQFMLKIALY